MVLKPLVVAKFGGSVLNSPEAYVRVAEVIERLNREYTVAVVVSAMKGVTDKLIRILENPQDLEKELSALTTSHVRVLEKTVDDMNIFGEAFAYITRLSDELARILWAVRYLRLITPKLRDYVLSFGERFSAKLLEAVLRARGLDAVMLTGWEAGIVTDDRFGEANPVMEETVPRVRSRLGKVLEDGKIPVITGFIAATKNGEITTLGRGGSDFTASLLASILGAHAIIFYTDVPGVMSTDPRIAGNAVTVPRLCIEEAFEFARAGGKKFHPRTFEPLREAATQTIITNINEENRTLVEKQCRPGAKTVALLQGYAMVNIEGGYMAGRVGTAALVTGTAARLGVNLAAFSQPVTETRISLLVKLEDVDSFTSELERVFDREGLPLRLSVERGIAAITVIGDGILSAHYMRRILEEAMKAGCNVYSVSPGAKDKSLCLLVDEPCSIEAVKRIHDNIVLPDVERLMKEQA